MLRLTHDPPCDTSHKPITTFAGCVTAPRENHRDASASLLRNVNTEKLPFDNFFFC